MDSPSDPPENRPQWPVDFPVTFPVDFPLSVSIADLVIGDRSFGEVFSDTLHRLEQNSGQQQVHVQVAPSALGGLLGPGTSNFGEFLGQVDVQGLPRRRRTRWNKPVVTLATVLEPTTYKEKEKDVSRSLGYIGAQRSILKWLQTHAADQFYPHLANKLTKELDEQLRYPNWKDALQLCYWMRSQGLDTYAQIHPKKQAMRLFIANPTSHERVVNDGLYWEQNCKSGFITELSFDRERASSRNALPNFMQGRTPPPPPPGFGPASGGTPRVIYPLLDPTRITHENDEYSLEAVLQHAMAESEAEDRANHQQNDASPSQDGTSQDTPPQQGDEVQQGDDDLQGQQQFADAEEPAALPTDYLEAHIHEMQEALEYLVETNSADTEQINELIELIEGLQQQITNSNGT
ncbi:hypothetical protein K458DRAFT_486112 [Lentithecium fluviatile CBS 122367]|uniref:Uncharacterized protein n=1 Tax=Lentithecium fluviatile CBS 122367 TaxID=1168545 RepID=A0A6G1J7A3_9PLEO|nr:hypothetical protein K458DRAFT_486112 [Lentithecium fluviatile CBS 122367]